MEQYSRGPDSCRASGEDAHVPNHQRSDPGHRRPDDDAAHQSLLSEPSDGAHVETRDDEDILAHQRQTWCPMWLRLTPLSLLFSFFVICAVTLPAMDVYSRKHDGLIKASPSLVYLWRFGPTAILTIASIFWARVELQALRYMPWVGHRREQSTGDGERYALDYTAMLSPVIIYKSLRRKRFLVFLVTVASIVLKVQIVLASGLFSLTDTTEQYTFEIQLLDSFNTTEHLELDSSGLTRSYYLALALRNFEVQRPFGLTPDTAHQTFTFTPREGITRGTASAPTTAVVDGLFAEAQCLKLDSWNTSASTLADAQARFEGCDHPVQLQDASPSPRYEFSEQQPWSPQWIVQHWQDDGSNRPCPNLPQQHEQWLYYAARHGRSPEGSPVVLSLAAVLCTSTSWLSKMRVVDNGINTSTTILPDEPKRPLMIPSLWRSVVYTQPINERSEVVEGPVLIASRLQRDWGTPVTEPDGQDLALYTTDFLYEATMNVSRILFPSIGHHCLRLSDQEGPVITGSSITTTNKLIVNQGVCLSMAALFVMLAGVALAVIIRYGNRYVWFRNPTTVLGASVYTRNNREFLDTLTRSVSAHSTTDWGRCRFTPFVLRTWVRALFVFIVLLIMTGLAHTLRLSQLHDGIATVPEDGYMHLLWTSLPALIMLSVAVYVSCCDSVCRGLSTLSSLATRQCNAEEIDMSHADMLGLQALFRSIQQKAWVVTSSQCLAIICGFLTTLTSVLYVIEVKPESQTAQLPQTTWLGSRNLNAYQSVGVSANNREIISSFTLGAGYVLAYPRNTYGDLLFPVLGSLDDRDRFPNTSVKVKVPAAQIHPTCYKVSPADYRIEIRYSVYVVDTFTCPNGTRVELRNEFYPNMHVPSTPENNRYLATRYASPENLFIMNKPCGLGLKVGDFEHSAWRSMTYAWGSFVGEKGEFDYFTIWRCNYTWSQVDTLINLVDVDGDLILDPRRPPVTDPATSNPYSPPFDIPLMADLFTGQDVGYPYPRTNDQNGVGGRGISRREFTSLIKPYGKFTMDAFGDPGQEDAILAELTSTFGIICAQLANLENRLEVGESDIYRDTPQPSLETIEATITDQNRRRLVQNASISHTLIAILALVSLVNLLILVSEVLSYFLGKAVLFDMGVKGLAPDGFQNMATLNGLLKHSNISKYLPEAVALLPSEELYGRLSGLNFRMGWFYDRTLKDRVFTVGVEGDDDFTFLGSAKNLAKEVNKSEKGGEY